MRNTFVNEIEKAMKSDTKIIFLTGDLGFKALEPLQENFPNRFFNVGIAEQNMIGVASGLALQGKKVIAYSIAPFISLRCFEQIRNDICYHNLDVKLIGAGGGFNYAYHGVTHHTFEDFALMRVLPNMTVIAPAFAREAAEAVRATIANPGPVYIRLGKNPSDDFNQKNWPFILGKGYVAKEGIDIVFVSTGNILEKVLATAMLVEKKIKTSVCVLNFPTLKPFDTRLLIDKAKSANAVFTFEEHSIIGGLGSTVATALSESLIPKKLFYVFGIPDRFIKDVGDRDHLLSIIGLEPSNTSKKIISLYKEII